MLFLDVCDENVHTNHVDIMDVMDNNWMNQSSMDDSDTNLTAVDNNNNMSDILVNMTVSEESEWSCLDMVWTMAFSLIVTISLVGNCLVIWIVTGRTVNVLWRFTKKNFKSTAF